MKAEHEWGFDFPWEMVNLRDWFYMVNRGAFGAYYFHVRILGIRSTWIVDTGAEIERLRYGIAGILLLSDDYTRNQNERFAMISTRARKPLGFDGIEQDSEASNE
jgi:hypothetical protein